MTLSLKKKVKRFHETEHFSEWTFPRTDISFCYCKLELVIRSWRFSWQVYQEKKKKRKEITCHAFTENWISRKHTISGIALLFALYGAKWGYEKKNLDWRNFGEVSVWKMSGYQRKALRPTIKPL